MIRQHNVFNIDNDKNQHIRMIFEESRDTVDRSNTCWKFSFASQEYITF